MPDSRSKTLPTKHIWPVSQDVQRCNERGKGQYNMKTNLPCAYMVMVGCTLLLSAVPVPAQIGSGSATMGQGSLDITAPGTDGDAPQGETGSTGEGVRQQDAESSGKMGSEGAIIVQPKPGEDEAPGSRRPPDRSTMDPGPESDTGSMGSSGGTGSSGGMGSGGSIGSDGGGTTQDRKQ